MPFKEKTAAFWHKVNGYRCACGVYTERDGMHECGKPSRQIHHIIPEGTALASGDDPEHAIGLPLCEQHHVRNTGSEEYSDNFAFHPDAGEAYREYREWKQQNEHMKAITGIRSKKIPRQSPFEDMVDEHHRMQKAGERYHSGTPELDDYYIQKMQDKATKYLLTHPGEKKPDTTPNPRYDPKKKKNWWDIFDGTRSYPEDEPPPKPVRRRR